MASPLSDCAKSFIRFVTGRQRQQLKQLLLSYKMLIQIELTALISKLGRNDIIAQLYKNTINELDTLLKPIENQLAQLPFGEFSNCADISFTVGNIENIYFDKKAELLGASYKGAQLGFASAHAQNLRNNLENQLDKADQLITYLDNIAHLDLLPSDSVYVYTSEEGVDGTTYPITRTGVIQGTPGITVSVLMDDTGEVEVINAADVQPIES